MSLRDYLIMTVRCIDNAELKRPFRDLSKYARRDTGSRWMLSTITISSLSLAGLV